MKIEVLYIEGCPNHQPAMERVDGVLRELGISEKIHEVPVTTMEQAKAFRFPGSPTIRIDDEDIEKEVRDLPEFSYSCRTYTEQGKLSGIPSQELIRRAIYGALEPNRG